MRDIRRILVPTDFGDSSTFALRQAVELADRFQADLDLLHVVEEPFSYVASAQGYLPELDLFRSELRKAGQRQLESVLSPADSERLHVKKRVVIGSPVAEILRLAVESNMDLIVLGTHGRGAVLHALLGSVAERVVRHATCPVLTYRSPQS